MDLLIETLIDTVIDTAKLLPILFLTYLAMEALEHYAGGKTFAFVKKARSAGPLVGSLVGVIPQCGFSGGAAGLYAAGALSVGTLIAVIIATSDEMLPILLSSGMGAELWKILLFKVIAAVISGFAVDFVLRIVRKGRADEKQLNVHEICEREGCDCEENEGGGIWLPALKHTGRVILMIFCVSLAIGLVFAYFGEDAIVSLPINIPVVGEMLSALFGLIPNCSVSVLLSNLYVDGAIGAGTLIAGLCSNGGVGLLVLYRLSGKLKKNIGITATLWALGTLWGIVASFIFAVI